VAAKLSASSGNWLLTATILGSSLAFIDGSVVSIALPRIQTSFHATAFEAQWVIQGYTLVVGALMLLSGALGDRYGRKRLFVGGVVLFAFGSVLCGIADSMPMLIASRVLQGIGGVLLTPSSLALIGANFEGAARGKAIGTWSGLASVTSAIGPVAGGAIVDHFGWRWVFFINIPLAIAVIAIALRYVPESRDEGERGPLDVLGSLLVTAALGAVVYGFAESGRAGWNLTSISLLAGGAAAMVAFVALERSAPNPILPLALFARRVFSGINIMTFFLYGALGGLFYFLPFVMIQVDDYSATLAGFAMLPAIALIVLLSRYSGALVYRLGSRTILVTGPLLAASGFTALAVLPDLHYWTGIFPGVLLIGLGMGFTVAPLTTTMIDSVPEHNVGVASGINNAVARVAALLAIAILGATLSAVFAGRLDTRMTQHRLSPGQRAQVVGQRQDLAGTRLRDPNEVAAIRAAYVDGFRIVALACALLALLSAVTAASTMPDPKAPASAKPS
jgi:EmrB/QacA subfamily drug resistance transporter